MKKEIFPAKSGEGGERECAGKEKKKSNLSQKLSKRWDEEKKRTGPAPLPYSEKKRKRERYKETVAGQETIFPPSRRRASEKSLLHSLSQAQGKKEGEKGKQVTQGVP